MQQMHVMSLTDTAWLHRQDECLLVVVKNETRLALVWEQLSFHYNWKIKIWTKIIVAAFEKYVPVIIEAHVKAVDILIKHLENHHSVVNRNGTIKYKIIAGPY